MATSEQTADQSTTGASLFWPLLLLAMAFPSLLAWTEFVALAMGHGGSANPVQQTTLALGKMVQFSLPVVFFWLLERSWPRPGKASLRGVPLGVAFGVVVAAGMFGLYYGFLRDSSVFGNTPAMVRRKLEEFGLDTPAAFFAFAGFLCVIHSFLEEYYWRWFVFGQLRRVVPLGSAILVSSFAFMAHHVIVLNVYFPGQFWTATLPFSLCVAGGGVVWAWLYQRSGSLLGPWLGHLLIDAAILVIGYDLVFGG